MTVEQQALCICLALAYSILGFVFFVKVLIKADSNEKKIDGGKLGAFSIVCGPLAFLLYMFIGFVLLTEIISNSPNFKPIRKIFEINTYAEWLKEKE